LWRGAALAQARSYSFNSVGTQKSDFDERNKAAVTAPPIGIKTPLELGRSEDGIFKMHRSLSDQIRDNLANLILTNHYERIGFTDFGANLRPILHELASENGDQEAMRRISAAVSKYMPFVSLDNFITTPQDAGLTALSKIKLAITYSVPRANISQQTLSITFNFTG
jgi:phage baseplate assembly protein W